MYLQYFNFNTAPFSIAPDPHFIFMSQHHQEGLAHLLYGINEGGGFIALTGEVGTGKTTLCHCLLEQLPDNIDIAWILNPKLSALELLANICEELNIPYEKNHITLKRLIDNLNNYLLDAHAKGRRAVLMIDEAQNLSLDVLEQIRLLTNLETSKAKLLQIILIGQPELQRILERPDLRQLNQRITARYHLTPFSYKESKEYIKHRLKVSGGNVNLFNDRAIRKIYRYSRGIPRLINILSDRALLGAYVTEKQRVSVKIVNKAAKEILTSNKSTSRVFLILGSIVLLFMLIFWQTKYLFKPGQPLEKHVILSGTFKTPTDTLPQLSPKAITKIYKEPAPIDFKAILVEQKNNSTFDLSKIALLWGIQIATDTNCQTLQQEGLYCLLDKSSWKDLITLDRPVVLEFATTESDKVYALMVGLEQGNPIFQFDKKMTIPLQQVLTLWDGYFLMLWQAPIQNINFVYPAQKSKAVEWIRQRFPDINSDRRHKKSVLFFDRELKQAVVEFQRQHHLTTDGIVGPRTFIHLKNIDPLNNSPKLKVLP